MARVFKVRPLGRMARVADALILPIMRLLAPRGDSPQLTHFWNNTRVHPSALAHLDSTRMARHDGDPSAPSRRWRLDIRFHLGAWKKYVVLEPHQYRGVWYVGWRTKSTAGISRIPVTGWVRGLVGPEEVEFFGIRDGSRDGVWEQIPVRIVAEGRLGDRYYTKVPLH